MPPQIKSFVRTVLLSIVVLAILATPFIAVPIIAVLVNFESMIAQTIARGTSTDPDAATEKMVQRVTSDTVWQENRSGIASDQLPDVLSSLSLQGLARLNDVELSRYLDIYGKLIVRMNTHDCAAVVRGTYRSDFFRMSRLLDAKDRDEWLAILGDAALAELHKSPIEPLDTFGLQGAISELRARSSPGTLDKMDSMVTQVSAMSDDEVCSTMHLYYDGYERLEPEAKALIARAFHVPKP